MNSSCLLCQFLNSVPESEENHVPSTLVIGINIKVRRQIFKSKITNKLPRITKRGLFQVQNWNSTDFGAHYEKRFTKLV